MQVLAGKTVLITGGTRGIGQAMVQKMAHAGAQVAFTYQSSHVQAKKLEQQLAMCGTVKGYCSDAADYNAAQGLIQMVIKTFGRLDVLVNNAGMTRDGLLLRLSEADWDQVVQVNLKSAFNTIKAVTKPFMQQRSGSIINMTSIVGIKGNAGQANYAAAKAGLIGLTKSVALELGRRQVRVNAIAPGFITTDMTAALSDQVQAGLKSQIPLNDFGTPEDVAHCAVFLASDAARYITGQVIQVDGGMAL